MRPQSTELRVSVCVLFRKQKTTIPFLPAQNEIMNATFIYVLPSFVSFLRSFSFVFEAPAETFTCDDV